MGDQSRQGAERSDQRLDSPMELLAFIPLAWMIRSDFRERVIRLYPLLFFGALTVAGSCWMHGGKVCLSRVMGGVGVLLFLMCGVGLYLVVRYGRKANLFREYLGMGDVLFLLCLTPSFGWREYTSFLVAAFTLTLLWWAIRSCGKEVVRGIPLVSTVGVCYACYVVYRLIYRLMEL